jgi:hypothetical protein
MIDLTDPAVIGEALDAFAVAQHPARGDERYLHASDLGKCDRETWARRTAHPKYDGRIDANTARIFSEGYEIEDRVLKGLNAAGAGFERGVRVAASIHGFASIGGAVVGEAYVPEARDVLGHPDGVNEDTLLEVKSTKTFYGGPPTLRDVEAQSKQYLLQSSTYALALGKPRGLLIVESKATGEQSHLPFDPRAYEGDVVRRIIEAQYTTTLDVEPPPTLHPWTYRRDGTSWLCDYCQYFGCKFNTRRLQHEYFTSNPA